MADPFDNATLRRSKEILEQAETALAEARQERQKMAEMLNVALWCDVNDHPFSGKDKEKSSITMTRWDEDKQQDVADIVMSCGPCAAVNPLIQAARASHAPVPAAAIGAPADRYNAAYTARMEREELGARGAAGTGPRGQSSSTHGPAWGSSHELWVGFTAPGGR